MAFAQGSRSDLSYVVESSFGTTPGSPAFIDLPFNSHSLNLTKQTVEAGEIRSDRQIADLRHGNITVAGDIEVDFRPLDYDDFLESAFFGTFSTGVLKCGVTPQFMSIEDRQLDINQYRLFTGMSVAQMSMSIKPNAMVTARFGMVGKTMTISGSSADATTTAGGGFQPYDSFTGSISEGGSPIAIVTGLDFQIDNGTQPTYVIGSNSTPQMEYGRSRVTGTVQAYFENATLINKFINETSSSISTTITDSVTGHGYTFLFPKVKYTSADVPVQSEQSRMVTMNFIALYNSSDATQLKLTVA